MTGREVLRLMLFCCSLAYLAGMATVWRFAKAFERYRRARVDFRATVDNAKGLLERIRDEGLRMLKLGTVVALVMVVAAIGLFKVWR